MSYLQLSHGTVEWLGWVLVHSVWQLTIVALLAAILSKAMRRVSAANRYWMLMSLLVLLVAFPLTTGVYLRAEIGRERIVDGAVSPSSTTGRELRNQAEPGNGSFNGPPTQSLETTNAAAPNSLAPTTPANPAVQPKHEQPEERTLARTAAASIVLSGARSRLRPWLPVIVLSWLGGACLFAIRPLLSCWMVWRLRRIGVSSAADEVVDAVKRISQQLGLRRSVAVLHSSLAQVPLVIGYLRPVILLPVSVVSGLPAKQIEAILAHELAHVCRHDYVVNIVQTLIETVFFYHPAVWWLSYRIRAERENCCDDAAVAVTSDRLEYGRALLALADMRNTSPNLALSASSGSLVDRIRRLVNSEAPRNTLGGGRPLGLALAAVLVGLMVLGLGVHGSAEADEGDETEKVEWGIPSHGLVCRIVPVDPEMDEQDVSMKKWDKKYSTSGNTTFAVELKNVSDHPIKLLGVRHAAGNKTQPNQSESNRFGPHLFHFEFTHSDGRPLNEASRQFAVRTQPMFLTDMSNHVLQPNETLKVLLRPAKFWRSTEYRIPPGKFRVKVEYRGPRQEVLKELRRQMPDRPEVDAWMHSVTSNSVGIWVAPDKNYREPKLVWGPEKNGLQAALEIVVPADAGDPSSKPGVLVGTSLLGTYHVKNVGDKTITFVSESGRQGDTVHVTDAGGRDVEVSSAFFTGWPIDVRYHLEPGEVARMTILQPSLSVMDLPGEYTVHYTIRFNSRTLNDKAGKQIFPAPGDWQTELDTGKTPLVLRREPLRISANGEIHGRLIDGQTGKPIRRGRVSCRPLFRESGKGGGADANTDSAGFYRLQPPAPGIYYVFLKKHPRSSRAVAVTDDGIVVEAGKVATSQLVATHGRYLQGTVRKADGKPAQQMVVHCYSAGRRHDDPVQRIRTKQDGTFAFYVPPGRTFVYTAQDGGRSIGWEASMLLDVPPDAKGVDPIMLDLAAKESNFAADDWLKRTPPGSRVTQGTNAAVITGQVVDSDGNPLAAAKLFPIGGHMVTADEQGKFEIAAERFAGPTLHAFLSTYRVWYGKPVAGDDLRIVMERKD